MGVPRMRELMAVSKLIKTPVMKVSQRVTPEHHQMPGLHCLQWMAPSTHGV